MRAGTGGAPLGAVWRRAAVLGSLWAASEIVLGSFLHNVRAPLTGHVLTAIGVAVLVAGHRRWRTPGLLARAGLIAALMKSISPSAVLVGPMLAIAVEGLLMEAAVRVLGGRGIAYAVGGALAMTWTLGQKIVSLVLTYGPDLVRLYRDVVALAERQVGSMPLGPWGPLAALAVLNLALGAGAALAGMRLGGDEAPAAVPAGSRGEVAEWRRRFGGLTVGGVEPRLEFLAAWAVALPVGLLCLAAAPLAGKALLAAGAVAVALGRYRPVLRRLGRPGFWASLLLVTMLAGAVAALLGGEADRGWVAGLGTGIGMSLNAVFVTLCFAALGTELTHQALRRRLERLGGGQLHRALHAAFATLPLVVAVLPSGREFVRSPARTLGRLLSLTEVWLEALEEPYRILGIVTGEQGGGKTTAAAKVVEALATAGVRVGGVLAPGEMRDGRRWAIDLRVLDTGRRVPLATRDPKSSWPQLGPFRVSPEGLETGRAELSPEAAREHDVLVVDEVGPWELAGEGWAPALERLQGSGALLLLVVRRALVSDVVARMAPGGPPPVWDVAAQAPAEIAAAALAEFERRREVDAPGPGVAVSGATVS